MRSLYKKNFETQEAYHDLESVFGHLKTNKQKTLSSKPLYQKHTSYMNELWDRKRKRKMDEDVVQRNS